MIMAFHVQKESISTHFEKYMKKTIALLGQFVLIQLVFLSLMIVFFVYIILCHFKRTILSLL